MYTPNANNKPATDKRKAEVRRKALNFASESKNVLQAPKRTVIISIMANYGLKVREARAIYKAA